MSAYYARELFDWLEPLLTDEECRFSIHMEIEAAELAVLIPTGDHWS